VDHDPEQADPDRKLTVVWSQDAMLRRTALERWFARNRRRLARAALLAAAYGCIVLVVGASLAEQLLKLPRRVLGRAEVMAAQSVAQRTGSGLSEQALRTADNTVLRAWWFVPRSGARGTVIVLHGQADNRAAMLGLAEVLLADGYRVLAADARAHGASGGAFATYGVLEHADLRAWADWAQRQFPDECVFGAGASMGAANLLQTLPDVPFCAAVADSAFADLPSLVLYRIGDRLHVPRSLHRAVAAPIVWAAMGYARLRHGVALRNASPIARFAGARVPVLIIHGTADREIPDGDARALGAANPRFATLWLVPGAAHTRAWGAAPRDYPARVLAFLRAHQ
jgi:alpha-beta hydrolase superfamily lysophospholipase